MAGGASLEINLTAVILAMRGDEPMVYASRLGAGLPPGLPSGPFDPGRHRTLELGLRSFAQEQAGLTLGYVEQLYTFGDRGRLLPEGSGERASETAMPHLVSIGYLALTRMAGGASPRDNFLPLYQFFPWEDWRGGRPAMLDGLLLPALEAWAEAEPGSEAEGRGLTRRERLALSFGVDGTPFDEEKVLERYELLYSAGLIEEALRDRRLQQQGLPPDLAQELGQVMPFDHRRILATALGRLRGKLKYRPVVFELMADHFTLTDLQRKVEAISGHHLHKQNFRRLVETGGLVEPTGEQTTTKGRPAALFRFRREVLRERPAPGLRLSASRSG